MNSNSSTEFDFVSDESLGYHSYLSNKVSEKEKMSESQDYSFSAAKLRQFTESYIGRSTSGSLYEDELWSDEANNLWAVMNHQDALDYTQAENGSEKVRVSWDHSDDVQLSSACWSRKTSSSLGVVDDLTLHQQSQIFSESSLMLNIDAPQFQSMVEEHLQGFGLQSRDCEQSEEEDEDSHRKRRLCRHFLKGHCNRGKSCDFHHDSSIFCPDLQMVFLGGLPAHLTEKGLRQKLGAQGYTVINKPKILRGFTPQVCLRSIEEAQRLVEKGKFFIDGSRIDVRPFESFVKDNPERRFPSDEKRSVFLGGLSSGTTGSMIKQELELVDVKVVNHPVIKNGFSPQVMLGSVDQAQKLVRMKKVRVNSTLVEVRPFASLRTRGQSAQARRRRKNPILKNRRK